MALLRTSIRTVPGEPVEPRAVVGAALRQAQTERRITAKPTLIYSPRLITILSGPRERIASAGSSVTLPSI